MKTATAGLLLALGIVILSATPLAASPVFTIDTTVVPNTVEGSVYFVSSSNTFLFDVRGVSVLDVSDPNPDGSVILYDPVFGQDNGFTVAPGDPNYLAFGNNTLFASNYPGAFNQQTAIAFDLTHPVFNPTTETLFALGTAVIPGNPSQTLDGPLRFDFQLTNFQSLPNGDALATYTLDAVSTVPEPVAVTMLALGIVGVGLLKRRHSLLSERPAR